MREIAPGIVHWSTFHEPIGSAVSSYLIVPAAIVLNPKVPDGGLESLPERPTQIVLTNGLHRRDSVAFATFFDAPILVSREAAERIGDALDVTTFDDGEVIAPGVEAIHIGALSDDEGALYIDVGGGAIAFSDGLVSADGQLAFVPDFLMGDDPEGVKRGLRQAFAGLLDRDFEHLLFAHGDPLVGGGKDALATFVGA